MPRAPIPNVPVTLDDPLGSPWFARGVRLAGIVLFWIAMNLPGHPAQAALLLASFGALVALNGAAWLPRFQPRPSEAIVRPGLVTFTRGRWPNVRIATRDVVGASTCRLNDGRVGVAVALKSRPNSPVLLTLERPEGAHAILDAWGIGHSGAGHIAFRTTIYETRAAAVLRGLANVLWFIIPLVESQALLSPTILASLVAATVGFQGGTPNLTLTPSGLTIRSDEQPPRAAPYREITNVFATGDVVGIATEQRAETLDAPSRHRMRGGLSETQREHLLAQLTSAVQRSRGMAAPRPELPARVELLQRGDEPVRAWLTRVESTAAQVLASKHGDGGYREGATFHETELWSVLESADADGYARAAAGRILARIAPDDVRVRIGDVLDTIADEATRQRIRVGLEADLEAASSELEAMEGPSSHARLLHAVGARRR